jgi:hypothetical protein
MEGIKRFKSLGDARRAGMPDMRWMGYVPNFAKSSAILIICIFRTFF